MKMKRKNENKKKAVESDVFETRDLRGNMAVVITRDKGVKYVGELFEYYSGNRCVVLRNYEKYAQKNDGWERVEKGDLIMIKGEWWIYLIVPRWEVGKKTK